MDFGSSLYIIFLFAVYIHFREPELEKNHNLKIVAPYK